MWFTQLSLAVYPYVSDTLFMGMVSGVLAPFLHFALESQGIEVTGRKAFWLNVALAITPYLVLILMLGAKGMPEPAELWKGVGTAVAASQGLYHGFLKKDAAGTAGEVEIPSPPSQDA